MMSNNGRDDDEAPRPGLARYQAMQGASYAGGGMPGGNQGHGGAGSEPEELESDGIRSEAELIRAWAAMVRALGTSPPDMLPQATAALAAHMEETAGNLDRQANELDREALRQRTRRR